MSIWTILLIILVIAVFSGGFYGGPTPGVGYYGRSWGIGGGTLILIVLLVLYFSGRL